MLNRLFPATIGNRYPGHQAGLWLFALLVLLTSVISVNSVVIPHTVAQSADAIPLDTFPTAAAQTIVSLFTLWGLSQLLVRLFCIIVLVRYRALVPLMYLFLLADALGRRLLLQLHPIARSGPTTSGFPLGLVLLGLAAVGLVLSLLPTRGR